MRQERIENIIRQRKPLAGRVMAVRERLAQAVDRFERFHLLCREMLQDRGLAEAFGGMNQISAESDRLLREAEERRDELTRLHNRLTRSTLNIAIIGRARQGKSRLLQTITGLSSEEIPDGSQAFCTGVRSDIINDSAVETACADVYFLTEERFLEERVAPYFEELKKHMPGLVTPESVNAFKKFSLPAPGSFRAAPGDITLMNLHLQHLKDLQDHLPQYLEYLGKRPLHITKEKIREYVAQDDMSGRRVFYKYMAVERVEIFCRFPNADVGSLRLIDLPGLGDTRIGDAARVVSTLKEQADLAFFLSKPSNTGAAWQDIDADLYSQAKGALGDKLPIERWAFWVFNHDSRPGADNRAQCELLQNAISSAQIHVARTVIADCADPKDVSENLIDAALEHLASSIEQNDREYAGNVQARLVQTMQGIHDVSAGAFNLLKDESDFDRDSGTFDTLFEELWGSLKEDIQSCVMEDSTLRRNRDAPCEPLKERIEQILSEERERDLDISADELRRRARRLGGLLSAYEETLHQLRTRLSRRLQENLDDILDGVLRDMKDGLCMILGTTGLLKRRFGMDDHRLLGEIIRFIESSGDAGAVPTLMEGLRLLEGWTMSYRSFIQHRLRSSLNGLDPLDAECMSMGSPANEAQALEILQGLYQQTIYKLYEAFNDIYSEPNKAAFAVAEEFKDIMIRPHETRKEQGPSLENQWRRFYRAIRGDVWPEEYGGSQRRHDAAAKMRGPLHELLPMSDPLNFNFLI